METSNFKTNPLLKTIEENDIVLMEVGRFKQICRIFDLKYQPADKEYSFDWLDFKAEVLYVNYRTHKTTMNNCIGNCFAITEIMPKELVEKYARQYDMWKSDMYMLSDAELESQRWRIEREFGNINK